MRIDAGKSFVPNVLVYCSERAVAKTMEVSNTISLSKSCLPPSQSADTNRKLLGYFRVPSDMHYLVVESNEPAVSFIIAAEGRGGIEACNASSGDPDLDPAGLALTIADLFADS